MGEIENNKEFITAHALFFFFFFCNAHFLNAKSLLVTPPDLAFSAFSRSTCVRGTGVSPRVPVARIETESSSLFSNLFMRLPMPGCVGFVGAAFFSSAAVAGVASLKAPKPLRHDGVDARPLSAVADAVFDVDEEEEEVLAAAAEEDEAAAPLFPAAAGSFS